MSNPVSHDIHWRANAKTDSGSVIKLGFWSVCVLLAAFLAWGVLFPLSSAVITPGTFVSDGKNKLVQHQKGGRVLDIFVREGQALTAGQPILELDKSRVQADLTQLRARHSSLNALKSRLDAERSGGARQMAAAPHWQRVFCCADPAQPIHQRAPDSPCAVMAACPLSLARPHPFPPSTQLQNPAVAAAAVEIPVSSMEAELLQSQRDAYLSGRDVLARQIESLEKKAATLTKQKDGLLSRIKSQGAMLAMNQREYDRLKPLASNGYVARNRLNDRERAVLELQGTV